VREGGPEVVDRFPNGIVHQHAAVANCAMELRRDIARLLFHPVRVLLPGGRQRRDVALGDGEEIDQDDRRRDGQQLLFNRKVGIQGAQGGGPRTPRGWPPGFCPWPRVEEVGRPPGINHLACDRRETFLHPAVCGLGRVLRTRVESDRGTGCGLVNTVDDFLEHQQTLGR
jgi:hypothetical protein